MDLSGFQAEFERLQAGVAPDARDGMVEHHMLKAFKRLNMPTDTAPPEVCALVHSLRPSWGYEDLVVAFQTRYHEVRTADILDEVWEALSPKIERAPGWSVGAVMRFAKALDEKLAPLRSRGKEGAGVLLPQDRLAALMGVRQQTISHTIAWLLKEKHLHVLVPANRGQRIAARYGIGPAPAVQVAPWHPDFR